MTPLYDLRPIPPPKPHPFLRAIRWAQLVAAALVLLLAWLVVSGS